MKTFEIQRLKTNTISIVQIAEIVNEENALRVFCLDEDLYIAVDHSTTAEMAKQYNWIEQQSFTIYFKNCENFEDEEERIAYYIEEVTVKENSAEA